MLIEELSKKLELPLDYNVCGKRRLKSISLLELLSALIEKKTAKDAATVLGISRDSITSICKELFPEKNSKQTWSQYLLSTVGKKRCSSCHEFKLLDEFADSKDKGKHIMCRPCLHNYGSNRYYTNKDQHSQWNKNWRANNPNKAKAIAARRRANKNKAMSEDADKILIQLIYEGCPEGYHVDHIIPISKGGEHHENNLCYLSIADNLHKKDKMPEDVPYIMARAIYPLDIEGFLD
jgi:hypothetical protein